MTIQDSAAPRFFAAGLRKRDAVLKPGVEDRRPSGEYLRLGRGAVVAAAVGALVVLARHTGVLPGWPALALLVVGLLAVPSSEQLSRRILLMGCLVFGWVPVLWWWRLPTGGIGRSGWLLAALLGVLAGWVSGGPAVATRLRRLVPKVRLVDVFPPLVLVCTAVLLRTRLTVHTGAKSLAIMLSGWDNVAHFDFVEAIRRHSVTIDRLPASPDGSHWKGYNYPQGFHTVAATLMELIGSPKPASISEELIWYVHATALIEIAAVTMVAAGVCALPQLRSRPALAAPLVALVAATFVLGPGGSAVGHGFANFVVACALVACAGLIAVTVPRVVSPLHLAALGGALVGVAHGWILLLVLCLPAVAVVILPFRSRRWSASWRSWAAAAAIVLATVLCVLRAVAILSSLSLGAVLTIPGGSPLSSVGLALAVIFASIAACVAARFRRGVPSPASVRGRTRAPAVRTIWLSSVPVAGLVTAAVIAHHEWGAAGSLSYYFWKFGGGVELCCVAILAVGIAAVRPVNTASTRPRRLRVVAASAALTVATTQVFGYVGPGENALPIGAIATGAAVAGNAADAVADRPAPVDAGATPSAQPNRHLQTGNLTEARRLLAALRVQDEHPNRVVVYLGIQPLDVPADTLGEQWYRALTQTWTEDTSSTGMEIPSMYAKTPAAVARLARRVLAYNSRQLVVVGPELLTRIRARMKSPSLQRRILSYPGP